MKLEGSSLTDTLFSVCGTFKKNVFVTVGQPRPFLLPQVTEWRVNVVQAALLCFSSLHLCRISKLL